MLRIVLIGVWLGCGAILAQSVINGFLFEKTNLADSVRNLQLMQVAVLGNRTVYVGVNTGNKTPHVFVQKDQEDPVEVLGVPSCLLREVLPGRFGVSQVTPTEEALITN